MSTRPFLQLWRRPLLGLGLLALTLSPACKDSRRLPPPAWRSTPGPVSVDGQTLDQSATPRQVADALIGLLQRRVAISRQGLGDPGRANELDRLKATTRELAAGQAIFAQAKRDTTRLMPHGLTVERAVEIITDDWAARVGHYIDHVQPDRTQLNLADTQATVSYFAENPADRRVLDEEAAAVARERDERGQVMAPQTDVFRERLRARAAARGVGPSPGTWLRLSLTQADGYWRVSDLSLAPVE